MNFLSTEPPHASCLPSGNLPGFGPLQALNNRSNVAPSRENNAAGKPGFVSIDIIDIT
jgi:hypothetical protein